MVGIWPRKEFRTKSNPEREHNPGRSSRAEADWQHAVILAAVAAQAWPNTYPALPAPKGPKGSNLAPGGTAPGGRRPGRPADGSMPGCGNPDRRGSTIIPPLRPLGRGKAANEMRLAQKSNVLLLHLPHAAAQHVLSAGCKLHYTEMGVLWLQHTHLMRGMSKHPDPRHHHICNLLF